MANWTNSWKRFLERRNDEKDFRYFVFARKHAGSIALPDPHRADHLYGRHISNLDLPGILNVGV